MRQIYASARLENVETVAKLLNEAGIETWVNGDRSYKGSRRSHFSYRESAQEPSSVWIVKAEDLSAANEIMRGAGLLRSTRDRDFVSLAGRISHKSAAPGTHTARRVRVVLILMVIVMAAITGWRMLPG